MSRELVLTFHGIGDPGKSVPEAERSYWVDRDVFDAFIERAASDAWELDLALVVTFDDGNRSDLEVAAPRLGAHGFSGIFFPCAGRFAERGYVGPSDLRHLAGAGFEIGSHGMDHVPWTTLGTAELERELFASKQVIEDAVGGEVKSAALPFGAYNRRVLTSLRRAGYTRVYSSDPGFSKTGAWFRRRWTYRAGASFDLHRIATRSARSDHWLVTRLKGVAKSLR